MDLFCIECNRPIEVDNTCLDESFIPLDICHCKKCSVEGEIHTENEKDKRPLCSPKISYKELCGKEIEEITKHRWYESEKAGHDVGLAYTEADWRQKYEKAFLKKWGYI